MKPISQTVEHYPPSGIRKFFDIVSQMDDVVSLGVGEPDFVTPWRIREAAINSLERGRTSYTSNWGLLELRRVISRYLEGYSGLCYNPENSVLITVGVSEGMDLTMRTLLNPGDEVIITEPCYVSYKACVELAGGKAVTVEAKKERDFVVDPKDIEAAVTDKTKAVLVSYPSNPTGAVADKKTLREIVDIAVKHDLYIVSDEIYDRLVYDGEHVSVPTLPGAFERTVLLNGFSKAYAMTGWRIGYAAGPTEVIKNMMKIHQYTMLCAPINAQNAAIEAIVNGAKDREDMRREYGRRRRVIVKGFREAGLDCFMPGGAFYAFPNVESTGLTSEEFCEKLLFEHKVAAVPGTAFGACGEGNIRCSYATSIEDIVTAIDRIKAFVAGLK
ncbi:MAG: aminotransferase class I/II-fold pyridoxal phosphate-dependent enzyme [Abditibacteriota bacterium]|nr:aminotransferase class I/II-fold pyridoxal phosphate-dependent enzyme [Abditibacteriota bacterium]